MENDLTFGDAPGGRAWVPLRPARRLKSRVVLALAVALVWDMVAMVFGMVVFHGRHGGAVMFALLLASGLVPAGVALYAWLTYRNLEDATIWVDARDLYLGQKFTVRVEQRARRGLRITDMKLGLICVESHPGLRDGRVEVKHVPLFERWTTLTRDKSIDHARRLAATRDFEIPNDRPPTTAGDAARAKARGGHAPVRWKLRLVTAAAGCPSYDADFPLIVRPLKRFDEEHASSSADSVV